MAAAASRIEQLQSLDTSALPTGMVDDLSDAWQASQAADEDFAEWADDELADGCTLDDSGDPGYQAATGPDDEATGYKQDFVDLWDSLADEYGLTDYQWNQL